MLTPVDAYYVLGFQRLNKDTVGAETAAKFGDDVGCHDGANAGFLTEWIFSLKKALCVASMINRGDDRACWAQFDMAAELYRNESEK